MTPEQVLERVRVQAGLCLAYQGPCPGGEVGAHYAASPEGERFVFKWFEGVEDGDWRLGIPERVERLRQKGYPAPRYLPPVRSGDLAVLVQGWVPGTWSDVVDETLVRRVLDLNALQAGEGQGERDWTAYLRQTLVEGADWYCCHEPMRSYSDQTRRMLDKIEGIGRDLGSLPGGDLVHFDLTHRNLLRTAAGDLRIVDCDAMEDGDRFYDLVTFALSFRTAGLDPGIERGVEPEVEDALWQWLRAQLPADSFTAYVAHMVLRRVEWKIRLGTRAEVEALIPRMAARLAQVG